MLMFSEKTFQYGNKKLLQDKNIEVKEIKDNGTIVYIAINKKYAGCIVISDKIKEGAKETIDILNNKYGIKTVIFSGDQEKSTKQIANKLKIDEYYSDLILVDKINLLEKIENKKEKNSVIAFIGDGVSDSPAISRADVGISIGNIESDSAIEASKVIIMNREIRNLIDAIYVSKKSMMIVKQNITFAITIKVLILLLIVMGISNMYFAVFIDICTSILCVLNSVRLLYIKEINSKDNIKRKINNNNKQR